MGGNEEPNTSFSQRERGRLFSPSENVRLLTARSIRAASIAEHNSRMEFVRKFRRSFIEAKSDNVLTIAVSISIMTPLLG